MTLPYYPQQQPMQQPAMPQYPVPQQQVYAGQPMVPQQNYYPQQPMQPPPQPLAQGTLSDYFNQPSTGGGPVFSWKGKPVGATYGGIVSRQITHADVQQQTMPGSNVPAYYRDGRPKYLMKVPLTVAASPEFPDGQAQWWVSGSARDELARAMAEAGCEPNTVPEAGAAIAITLTGERPSGPGMNPSKTYRVQYRRPPRAPQPTELDQRGIVLNERQTQQVQQAMPQPGPIANTPAQVMQQMQPVLDAAQQQQAVTMPPQVVHTGQMMQQPQPQPAPPQPPNDGLDDAQRKLLAELTSGN